MFSKKENSSLENSEAIAKEVKNSGKDWVCYVQNHPVQSLFFGAAIGLALKGLFKK